MNIPNHVGIIMDGNGRWATKRGLSRSEGHLQGSKTFKKLIITTPRGIYQSFCFQGPQKAIIKAL